MARLTVEDCLRYVENRFDLVLKASVRARLLERGAAPRVKWENDKPTVVALREIAEGIDVTAHAEPVSIPMGSSAIAKEITESSLGETVSIEEIVDPTDVNQTTLLSDETPAADETV